MHEMVTAHEHPEGAKYWTLEEAEATLHICFIQKTNLFSNKRTEGQ